MRTLYMLKRAETAARSGLESALRRLGITPGQYTTLSLLKERSLSSADLARKAGISPQSMSETIANLIRKKLIHRAENPKHGRILIVSLTAAGDEVLAECESEADSLERLLFRQLAEPDILELRRFLRSIVEAAEAP